MLLHQPAWSATAVVRALRTEIERDQALVAPDLGAGGRPSIEEPQATKDHVVASIRHALDRDRASRP